MREIALTLNNFIVEQKQRIIFISKVIISIVLLVYLFNMLETEKIINAFNNINYYFLSAAIILLIPNIYLQFIKWKIVCANSLDEFNNKKILTSIFLGFSGAVITPMRLGEIAGRVWGIRDKDPVKVTAAVFLDKIFTLIQNLLIGVFAACIYAYSFLKIQLIYIIFLLLIVLSGFLLLFLISKKIKQYGNRFLAKIKFISKIINVFDEVLKYNSKAALYLFIASFFFYICYLVQFSFLVSAFTGRFMFFQYLWAASLIMLVKAFLPISIGELGVRESASIFFLSLVGTQPSAAFNASIFLFVINILLPALPGSYLFLRKK